MTIDTTGLISMEFDNVGKTLTLVYEPHALYSLVGIIDYADDMSRRVIILEGDELIHTLVKDKSGWIAIPSSS